MTKSLISHSTNSQEELGLCSNEQEIPETDYHHTVAADAVEAYLHAVRRHSLLSKDEEFSLARAARSGDSKAAMRLAQGNLRLVIRAAKQYRDRGLSFEDLIQEGNLGLLKAVQRFDPERGFRFSTYAVWWIRQSIVKAIGDKAKLVKIPMQVEKDLWRAKNAAEQLRQELGREPSIDELAERTLVPAHRLRLIYGLNQEYLSLDAPAGEEHDDALVEMLKAETSSDEEASRALLKEYLEELIGCLNCRERDIIQTRYGLGQTQTGLTVEETAKLMNMSIERVKRIESRALLKLRRCAQEKQLNAYLAS